MEEKRFTVNSCSLLGLLQRWLHCRDPRAGYSEALVTRKAPEGSASSYAKLRVSNWTARRAQYLFSFSDF